MARSRGRGPTLAKDINRRLVYQQIKQKRSTSRVEVAKLLRLNKNTVNSIVDELIAAGFVEELGQLATYTAGRKPIQITFNPGAKWAIGAQLTSTVIHWTVSDLYANPIHSFSVPLEQPAAEDAISALTAGVDRLNAEYPIEHCLGFCVGVPGLIASDTGTVVHSTHLGWSDIPILELLRSRLSIPVQVDNSIKLASLGELWHGSGQGLDHFVYCYFGNGVGCSSIVAGSILRGAGNAAGELGHIVVDPDGPLCRCGNRGCLEAIIRIPALLERVSSGIGSSQTISLDTALSELSAGNAAVVSEFEQAGRYIGQALSYVTNLFNPRLIICDGPLMDASPVLFPIMENIVRRRSVSITADQAAFIRSKLYPYASSIGAAALVIQAWESELESVEPATS